MVPERPGCSQFGPPGTICSACIGAPAAASTANASALASSASAVAEPDQCRPMPFDDAKPWRTPAAADELILRPVAPEDLSDFEQRDVGKSAIAIGLRRGDQARQQARPHVGQIGGDRIGEREFASARRRTVRHAALAMNDQVTASTMPRAASARLARRVRSWIGGEDRLARLRRRDRTASSAPCRRRRCARSPRRCRPCRARRMRQDGTATFTTGPLPATMKPRWPRMRFISGKRHVDAGEPLDLSERKIDHAVVAEGVADHDVFRRRAAAQFHHQLGSPSPAPAP